MKLLRILSLLVALIPAVLGISGGEPSALEYRLTRESEPYVESVLGWIVGGTATMIAGQSPATAANADEVRQYFAAVSELTARTAGGATSLAASAEATDQARAELETERPLVETAIERDVARVARADGLETSLGGRRFIFPPVYFKFESPPSLLVVSPRDHIERAGTVLLRPGLSTARAEQIEARASSDQLSALVTSIGGLGVYPSMVPESSDPRWTFQTVAHEWTHQFLALRPLGWKYALGGESDERMITLNETVAEIMGSELGDAVFEEYYPDAAQAPPTQPSRDSIFGSEMREIRTTVDRLLGQGEISDAEAYMEASRRRLAGEGFYIRKLNQAYFAFYGSYAQDPALSSPTGADISRRARSLQTSSPTLGDFLWRVSAAGSYDQFMKITASM